MIEPAWVKPLRDEFPAAQKMAFFDIAYENCGALFAQRAVERYFAHKAQVYPGILKAGGAGKGPAIDVIAKTRTLLKRFLGCKSEKNLAFLQNTNAGMNAIMQGFPFEPGDNVVVGDLEHVAVLMPCLNAQNANMRCKIVKTDGLSMPWEALIEAADEHTRMIAVSHVQSSSGYKTDLKALAEACHARGIYLVVDAIQSLGFTRFNVEELGVDAVCASTYKGMLGIDGVAFLYCADGLLEKVQPVFAGFNAAFTMDRETSALQIVDALDARKLENGTIPFIGIYALHDALERLLEIGMEEISAHIAACYDTIYAALQEMGYEMLTPADPTRHCNSMLARMGEGRAMYEYFMEHGVYCSAAKMEAIRISCAPFTAAEDIEALLRVAEGWKAAQG